MAFGQIWKIDMSNADLKLIDLFASHLLASGVPIRREDNAARLQELEAKLSKRLPPSFAALLARYSFPSFDAAKISFFGWESAFTEFSEVVPPGKNSLSEILLPAGYLQIGQPDTGSFDAICFDMNIHKQNREYRIVTADHEQVLCYSRIKLLGELWPSFRQLVEQELSLRR